MDKIKRPFEVFSRPPTPYVPGSSRLPTLDVADWSKKAKLAERAVRRGESNLPPTESTDLDEIEIEILNLIDTCRQEAVSTTQKEIQRYTEDLQSIRSSSVLSEVIQQIRSAIGDMKALSHSAKTELYDARERVRSTKQELQIFRKVNELTHRNAEEPTLVFGVLLLVVFFLGEVIVNATFLSEGSSGGMIGGLGLAIGFSVINIGLPVILFASWVRYLFHQRYILKLFGFVGAAIWFTLAITLNMGLGHYRIALVSLVDNPAVVAWTAIGERLLNFGDTESAILFVLGFSLGLAALLDRFFLSDRYPEYTKKTKNFRHALDDYKLLKSEKIEQLQDKRDNYIKNADEALTKADERLTRFHEKLARRRNLHQNEFPQYMMHLENKQAELLKRYRAINSEHRTEAPPRYFEETVAFEDVKLNPIEDGRESEANHLSDEVTEESSTLRELKEALNTVFDQSVESLPTIDDILEWDGVTEERKQMDGTT